jgi:hypothetical protein
MKAIYFLCFLFCLNLACLAQPDNIKRIMAKQKTGQEITEEEQAAFEKWIDEMTNQAGNKNQGNTGKYGVKPAGKTECPLPKTVPLKINDLTRDSYVAMAKGLMAVYGSKSGDLSELKSLVEASKKPTDGSDMGALFKIVGAGSASVYVTAYSAVQKPDDILTANNLGVMLKDMGEYTKALQVLRYADKLKPNIGLILCNTGWVYREMGYPADAKQFFEKALKVAPEMASPYLGLGLMAKCEGNFAKAEEYLSKALPDRYSAVGFAAYQKAKESQPPKPEGSQDKPLAKEKGNSSDVTVPEMPIYEEKEKTASQKELIQNYMGRIDSRMQQLIEEYNSTLSMVMKQGEKAMKDPDNAIVFRRDFSKELMLFQDATMLLFGENSNYGRAVKEGTKILEQNSKYLEKDLSAMEQHMQKSLRLQEQLIKLIEEMTACGNNELCKEKVQAKIDQNQYEAEQEAYQMCLLQKGEMDMSYSSTCKAYKGEYNTFSEAVSDYYAFTNPILERIYSPSFNELENLYREMFVLSQEKAVQGLGSGLPDLAEQYNELKCVEPKPPEPPAPEPQDSNLPKKKEKDCPLGKGINAGFGGIAFELDCSHVNLSGGEGVLWSVKRDFDKHETIIWGGVGAKGTYGNGNVTGEASVGVEVTIGQGDVIKDVVFTSSVKAGLGGLVEGEVSGRLAMEGGASIETGANLVNPGFPGMGN